MLSQKDARLISFVQNLARHNTVIMLIGKTMNHCMRRIASGQATNV